MKKSEKAIEMVKMLAASLGRTFKKCTQYSRHGRCSSGKWPDGDNCSECNGTGFMIVEKKKKKKPHWSYE